MVSSALLRRQYQEGPFWSLVKLATGRVLFQTPGIYRNMAKGKWRVLGHAPCTCIRHRLACGDDYAGARCIPWMLGLSPQ